jgi:hypothetical protein
VVMDFLTSGSLLRTFAAEMGFRQRGRDWLNQDGARVDLVRTYHLQMLIRRGAPAAEAVRCVETRGV